MKSRCNQIAAVTLLMAGMASAATVDELTVERDGERLEVHSVVRIGVPRDFVYEILLDYDALDELSERFVEAAYVDPGPDGRPRIRTVLEGCVAFFCRMIERVATVDSDPPHSIEAIVIPELSDLSFGRETWLLEEGSAETTLVYDLRMEVEFWIPPLIGPWLIRRDMRKDARKVAEMIESMYAERQTGGAE